ncbi:MAG: methyltransferase domain-containing protein [Alphaproteobacteria bacterium]|nr:methyltransferase domain-containing protein [Alphaproteobacteria bacterium]
MYRSVYDLKTFYTSPAGLGVQRILQKHIESFWPDVKNLRIMGCGYALPYLQYFRDQQAERVFAMMPAGQGAHQWPEDAKNLVFLSDESAIPLENSSVDRIILIHDLECNEHLQSHLSEIWRILKANGRLLVIVPNRTGFWARADWSPFGHGSPFSLPQLCHSLRDNLFVQERTESALFLLPLPMKIIMRSAIFWEHMGKIVWPFLGGVHIVEASKQIYAGVDRTPGSKVPARLRGLIGARPATPGLSGSGFTPLQPRRHPPAESRESK